MTHLCRESMASCNKQFKCLQDDSCLYRESMSHPMRLLNSSNVYRTTHALQRARHPVTNSHPETFELFVTGCHASLQRWAWHPVDIWTVQMSTGCHVISAEMSTSSCRHLNCLLQDAMLISVEMSMASCRHLNCSNVYRMPCHLCRDESMASCRHLNCSNVYRMSCSSLQRWAWHPVDIWTVQMSTGWLMSLLRESMSHPVDIWTVQMSTGCHAHLWREMSIASCRHLNCSNVYRMSCSSLQRWAWHPVDIWTVQMSTGCHAHLYRDEHGIL